MPQINDPMLGLYRNATKPLTDFISILLAGTERLQNAQLTATQELLSNQSSMERQLLEASSIHEAVDIQGKASRDSWSKALSALHGIYTAGSINQMELIRQSQSQALQIFDTIDNALEDMPGEAAQLTTGFKLAIGAARATYAANIRATEEAARLAANGLDGVLHEAPVAPSKRQAA